MTGRYRGLAVVVSAAVCGVAMTVSWAYAATITGTPGPDVLVGTGDADTIEALAGNDYVTGKHGNDIIRGGPAKTP